MSKLVLVVDDSAVMRKVVSKTLTEAGFRTIDAPGGKEALEKARSTPDIAMVVTDQNMPGMTGIELVVALRAEPAFKFTPIVFLTTESGKDIMDEARAAGATAWVTKPFSPEKLLSVVNKVAA